MNEKLNGFINAEIKEERKEVPGVSSPNQQAPLAGTEGALTHRTRWA
jgi:hypothetical protein